VVLVVNSGTAASDGPSSIDVIDPEVLRVVATIPLGATRAGGKLAITADGARAFVGGTDFVGGRDRSELYLVDIAGIDAELGNAASATLPGRALRDAANPLRLDRSPRAPFTDAILGLALSPSDHYLYAVNFNASMLFLVEVTAGLELKVQDRLDLARGADPAAFENTAQLVAVRPGTSGLDYRGPDLYLVTMNFQDPVRAANRTALEAVTTDKH
jgi:DNA-binding beta-propeller fold protein YncE